MFFVQRQAGPSVTPFYLNKHVTWLEIGVKGLSAECCFVTMVARQSGVNLSSKYVIRFCSVF